MLGLYGWEGLDPVLPELWLLPERLPFHPSRLWCHSRMVYLPMAYLYGRRATVPLDERLSEIRHELYGGTPWEAIAWRAGRGAVSETDRYVPRSLLARAAFGALSVFEQLRRSGGAGAAQERAPRDRPRPGRATDFICLGPVNKLFNTLVWHFENPGGPELARHVARLPDYLWRARDGVEMQGYNSSELWDTAFAAQAMIAATGRAEPGGRRCARRTASSRQPSDGRRPGPRARLPRRLPRRLALFHARARLADQRLHRGSAESLAAPGAPASTTRFRPSGCAAAERFARHAERRRRLGDVRKDARPGVARATEPVGLLRRHHDRPSYVECTSACVQALAAFKARHPARRRGIDGAIARGRDFLLASQRADGSWEGSWGICFTYGTWFGTWGLRAAGLAADHPALSRAARFLLSKQLPDGGWGELAESCRVRAYVHAEGGQAVMTSWALLALAAAGHGGSEAARRGASFLAERQRADGSFPDEHIAGMFNKTCAIHYDNYLAIFPLWAMAVIGGAAREPASRRP